MILLSDIMLQAKFIKCKNEREANFLNLAMPPEKGVGGGQIHHNFVTI